MAKLFLFNHLFAKVRRIDILERLSGGLTFYHGLSGTRSAFYGRVHCFHLALLLRLVEAEAMDHT